MRRRAWSPEGPLSHAYRLTTFPAPSMASVIAPMLEISPAATLSLSPKWPRQVPRSRTLAPSLEALQIHEHGRARDRQLHPVVEEDEVSGGGAASASV